MPKAKARGVWLTKAAAGLACGLHNYKTEIRPPCAFLAALVVEGGSPPRGNVKGPALPEGRPQAYDAANSTRPRCGVNLNGEGGPGASSVARPGCV